MLNNPSKKIENLSIESPVNLDKLNSSKWWYDVEADLGLIPDDESEAANNTTKLRSYFTMNATQNMPPLCWHAKKYWLSGILHNGNDAGYRSFSWFGVSGAEFAAQHLEDSSVIVRSTQILIKGLTRGQVWLQILGSTNLAVQPKNIKFRDLVFMIPSGNSGEIFEFGDPSLVGSSDSSLLRSVIFDNCYLSEQDHIVNTDLVNPSWAVDDPTDGLLLKRTKSRFLARFNRVYDLTLEMACRGGNGPQVWLQNCDSPKGKFRSLLSWQAFRSAICKDSDNDFLADGGVPGWFDIYIETPLISGLFATAGSYRARVESGYSLACEPNIGVYSMPASVTWHIESYYRDAQASRYIQFENLPTGRTVEDYFEPGMYVRLVPESGGTFNVDSVVTPDNALTTAGVYVLDSSASSVDGAYVDRHITGINGSEPNGTNTYHARKVASYVGSTRTLTLNLANPSYNAVGQDEKLRIADDHEYKLIISEVDPVNNRVYFAGNGQYGLCKTTRHVAGTGDNVFRAFGTPVVLAGERVELNSASIGVNESYPNLPKIAATPYKTGMIIRSSFGGTGVAFSDKTQLYELCGHCRPLYLVPSHVQFQGYDYWDHPYVIQSNSGIIYEPSHFKITEYNPTSDYPYLWKAGVHESSLFSSERIGLHKKDGIWTYYMGDQTWLLPIKDAEPCSFAALIWTPQIYEGTFQFKFSESENNLSSWTYETNVPCRQSGWQMIYWQSKAPNPTNFRIDMRDLYVAWVGGKPNLEIITQQTPYLNSRKNSILRPSTSGLAANQQAGTEIGLIKTISYDSGSDSMIINVNPHIDTGANKGFNLAAPGDEIVIIWDGNYWSTILDTTL